jgi:hypothetical protein
MNCVYYGKNNILAYLYMGCRWQQHMVKLLSSNLECEKYSKQGLLLISFACVQVPVVILRTKLG